MNKTLFVALVVSIGGFLFGFDAGIISGVMSYATPEFNLTDIQNGWATSAPSAAAILAMLFAGRWSDTIGRRKILIYVAVLYAVSALWSAYATGFHMLWMARFIGGLAFGAALVVAPAYIAEIAPAQHRGRLVSVQQLNIVLGFFAAFISNYLFNSSFMSGSSSVLTQTNVWRWMLGVEVVPAVAYLGLLILVPRSPRWLLTKGYHEEARQVLTSMQGQESAEAELQQIEQQLSIDQKNDQDKVGLSGLWSPALRYVLGIGLIIGVLQQITGINAVYFYATSIFKQTGIGTDAAFASGIWLSLTTVVFTVIAMFSIDKWGRRPLMLVGVAGIALSLLLCAYGFKTASYKLTNEAISSFDFQHSESLMPLANQEFSSDVMFKTALKEYLGEQVYNANDGQIMEAAISMNASLVLVGILGFIACFAFSLGPVMWVMLSELYPNRYRGAAIGFIASINGFVSWLVQFIFPWELSNLGNAMSFFIFGAIALVGFLVMLKYLPETKGKSLEAIERDFIG